MDREGWDARYAARDLLWGEEPNLFLTREFAAVPACGKALDVACGEGRNALWLASRGWKVTAVDYSRVALGRARRLAAARGAEVDWIEADATAFVPSAAVFRLVVIAYLQVPAAERRLVFGHAAAALAPGGTLFLIGHARRNLTDGVGGPGDPGVLWEPSEIRDELTTYGFAVLRAEHVTRPVETEEGVKHAIDAVIRAQRRRPPGRFAIRRQLR